jgi:endonuclease YncB( thermonuclease family)
MFYVILEKSKGFRMAKYTHKLGEEESQEAKKERHGMWTPKSERMRELARRRREEEGEEV